MNQSNKAVFFDRDGTLIKEAHYLSKLEQIELFAQTASSLWRLKEAGYKLVMITNQSGVARGYFTEAFVLEAFEEINRQLGPAAMDRMEYCPHHLQGLPPLNMDCDCRKPKPSMILKAAQALGLDLSSSFMVGDKRCDIELGYNAGVTPFLVTTGYGLKELDGLKADYPKLQVFANLAQMADHILAQAPGFG